MSEKTNKKQGESQKDLFIRIDDKFKEWWFRLFYLTAIYTSIYLVWRLLIDYKIWAVPGKNNNFLSYLFVALAVGLMYCVDGWVTSLLKGPFNQLAFTINKLDSISYDRRDYLITKATETNEHFKETFKKFGILTISVEFINFYIDRKSDKAPFEELGKLRSVLLLAYFVPVTLAFINVLIINKKLKKIEKELNEIKQD